MSGQSQRETGLGLSPAEGPGQDESDNAAVAWLLAMRPHVRIGSVFRLADAVRGLATGKEGRPTVVVVAPRLHERPSIALGQQVQVAGRLSWKLETMGPIPTSQAEMLRLLNRKGWAYSAAGSLGGFTMDGVFEVQVRWPIAVRKLVGAKHLGWLPRPTVEWLAAYAGVILPDPYPPDC